MKLKFKTQDFQTDAVNAVADLFAGKGKMSVTFSVTEEREQFTKEYEQLPIQNEFGVGNALLIDDEALNGNMNAVQSRNRLPVSNEADLRSFCVEMETGTGKTYVYTKTIFELNRRYGFTKFIIVVPSVAIREGVYKSFEITAEHFGAHYDNVPCRYFIYNSAKLSDVRQFATSNNIEIMIINIDAFKKAENIINQQQDRLNGETAMRYIQDTNPVVIIDEPQSVDNTPKAREAIASLNPLCVLRYSATHRDKHNLLYRLTPVDAYQMGLVKQIVVYGNTVENDHNKPYIALKSVKQEGGFRAKIEIDVLGKNGAVTRKTVTAKPGDDLFKLSGNREIYEGYSIAGIDCAPGRELIEFSDTSTLALGKSIGGVDEMLIKRAQIMRTIESHFDKELMFMENGKDIKVLSLFFIDKVENYRTAEGEKGIYAEIFESCFEELLARDKYAALRGKFPGTVETVHNGYFSQDKKGAFKNTKGDTLADDDTYNTIMRDKEWLLSFDCPLRFIWSHSALKEGWDNPNVFQVCTLIEQKSTFTQRQKIGRGLRLCVDQQGNRIEDRNINILHVMANESFAEFAQSLQKEIEAETGVKFGMLQISLFVGQTYEEEITVEKPITAQQAEIILAAVSQASAPEKIQLPKELEPARKEIIEAVVENKPIAELKYSEIITEQKAISYDEAATLMTDLEEKELVTKDGKIKDILKAQLAAGTLDLGERFSQAAQKVIIQTIERADSKPPIRDGLREVKVRLKKQVLDCPKFMEIWDRIKQKTTYRVALDRKALMKKCIDELKAMPPIQKARLVSQTADLNIEHSGITHTERSLRATELGDGYHSHTMPDIIRVITTETLLKRNTVVEILESSGRGKDFINNPQAFTEKALEIIARNRHSMAIDGIKYIKLAGEEYSVMEIFDAAELVANLDRNATAVNRSLYDHVIYDSNIENSFAKSLDDDPDVKLFFKIPKGFKIETPIGTYNPDWAVYLEQNGDKKLYFVLETKGTTSIFDLRTTEQLKLKCGKAHFDALENDIAFSAEPVRDWREFRKTV